MVHIAGRPHLVCVPFHGHIIGHEDGIATEIHHEADGRFGASVASARLCEQLERQGRRPAFAALAQLLTS